MNKATVVCAALMAMNSLASAEELLISGNVESILLLRSGSEHCPDAVRWSALEQKNGTVFFESKPFKSIGGVAIASLPHDGDGLIRLASLVDHLKSAAH